MADEVLNAELMLAVVGMLQVKFDTKILHYAKWRGSVSYREYYCIITKVAEIISATLLCR